MTTTTSASGTGGASGGRGGLGGQRSSAGAHRGGADDGAGGFGYESKDGGRLSGARGARRAGGGPDAGAGGGRRGYLGVGGVGGVGASASIDDIVFRFRRDRINPSSTFVHRALVEEPSSHRSEAISLTRETINRERDLIEERMRNLCDLEDQVTALETDIEIIIKSTISLTQPKGMNPSMVRPQNHLGIPKDLVGQHATLISILEIIFSNPNYLRLMHKYYTGGSPDVKQLWESNDARMLSGTFLRRFAHMATSIYGDLNRPRNEHLFLVFAKSIMLEELVGVSLSGADMGQVAAKFVSGDSVFGELVRSYFSLPRNVKDVINRYADVMREMTVKTATKEFDFEYDPIEIYLEQARGGASSGEAVSKTRSRKGKRGGGSGDTAGQQIFDDAYREDLYSSVASVKSKVNSRVSQLCEVGSRWLEATQHAVNTVAPGVRWLAGELFSELTKQYGAGMGAEYIVANFLFDTYFRPALLNPAPPASRSSAMSPDGRMSKKLIKNLNEIAVLVKRALTNTHYSERCKWMLEANSFIERSHKSSLLWISELCYQSDGLIAAQQGQGGVAGSSKKKLGMRLDLPQAMIIDVYNDHLRHGRMVHTLRLPDVLLLRWMLLRFDKVAVVGVNTGSGSRDPLEKFVLGTHGLFPPGAAGNDARKRAAEFATRPETFMNLGMNYELNTRFFRWMRLAKVRVDPSNEVPLPHFLATPDCTHVSDPAAEALIGGLDKKRLAFMAWLRSPDADTVELPESDNYRDIREVRLAIDACKERRKKRADYAALEELNLCSQLLDQLSQEHIPLSQVMGELLEKLAQRRRISLKQKRVLDSLYALRTGVEQFERFLYNRRAVLEKYKEALQCTKGLETGNRQLAQSAAQKVQEKLTPDKIVVKAHSSLKPSDLKRRLAQNQEVRGCHRAYTYKSLASMGVVVRFEMDPSKEMSPRDLKKIKRNLKYLFSLTTPGVFNVVAVYDGDTVLDHFFIRIKQLLAFQRALQVEWTPNPFIVNDSTTAIHKVSAESHAKNDDIAAAKGYVTSGGLFLVVCLCVCVCLSAPPPPSPAIYSSKLLSHHPPFCLLENGNLIA